MSSTEEMDSSVGEEVPDERMKKKQQNSVRWKRWWMKNREAYNEKRRLSAQVRSAKLKAEKNTPTNGQTISKRIKMSPTEQTATLAPEQVVISVQPTISPIQNMRSVLPPLTLPPFTGVLSTPQQLLMRNPPTLTMPQIFNMKPNLLHSSPLFPGMLSANFMFSMANPTAHLAHLGHLGHRTSIPQ